MMNTGKLCLAIGSLAMLNLPLGLHAQAGQAAVPATPEITALSPKDTPDADPDVVKAAEKLRFVTAGYKAGANTSAELNEATLVLANAQIRSAIRLDNTKAIQTKAIQQALATIVVQRQQLLRLTETEYTAGAVGTDVMTQSQIALAQANARVDLYSLVSLRKQALSQVQMRYKVGAATEQELTGAQDAYQEAQRLFSESGDGS